MVKNKHFKVDEVILHWHTSPKYTLNEYQSFHVAVRKVISKQAPQRFFSVVYCIIDEDFDTIDLSFCSERQASYITFLGPPFSFLLALGTKRLPCCSMPLPLPDSACDLPRSAFEIVFQT
jgi:hypothetical protein